MPNITEAGITPWSANWAGGLPLILLTVVVFGLGIVNEGFVGFLRRRIAAAASSPCSLW